MNNTQKCRLRTLARDVGVSEILAGLAELVRESASEMQLSGSPAERRAWDRAACVLEWFSGSFAVPQRDD